MEHNQFPVKLFAGGAFLASLLVSACNNNDTNTTAASETSSMTAMDSPSMMTEPMPMAGDTATMPATGAPAKGVAIPNASKKGLKGKTVITEPPRSTAKADAAPDASGVYANVDRIPAYPGGYAALQKYFNDNIRYPNEAAVDGVEGTVRVAFTVDEQGRLMNPVIEGAPQGYGLDEEALRVVSAMPVWNAGLVGGKPVRTKFVLPVQFRLE